MGELRRVIEEDIQVAKEIVPRFRKCMKPGNNILAILGAIIGGFAWISGLLLDCSPGLLRYYFAG